MSTAKTELEQAIEARKEAQEYHREVKCMLQRSRDLHDSTLANQRKITYALTSLMPQSKFFVGVDLASDSGQHAEQVHEVAKQFADREIHAVIHSIMVLAVSNQDVLHVWFNFSAHVNTLEVDARPIPIGADKYDSSSERFLYERVHLDNEFADSEGDALTNLLAIEDKLIDLVAEAREAKDAEVAA
ncbi:hypothetical protein KS876_001090 [Vibrio parahaemolyticus]|nr:hypothetical protein [Vibrio parahaemolyticus]ELA9431988.1 hypothetical protein [Vibrio parahaemolyticus]